MDAQVRSAALADAKSVADVLRLAFSEDPFFRWAYPSASTFQQWFPKLVWRYSGAAFLDGTADWIGNGIGAALWLRPERRPDVTKMNALLESTVHPPIRDTLWRIGERLMDATPVQPYWHLTFLGVDPARQGEGAGTALLEHGLARCDEDDDPAYLETSNPRTLSFLTRHGFEIVDIVRTGDDPTVYALARDPARDMR